MSPISKNPRLPALSQVRDLKRRCLMNPEILDPIILRLFWIAGIITLGFSLYWLLNRLILKRARRNVSSLNLVRPGSPILLYFTTPSCVPCKTTQRPAIQQVKDRLGVDLQVIEVDANAQPKVASQWGVMSVPTTFIIDRQGKPRHVNHGVTSANKLLEQYYNIGN